MKLEKKLEKIVAKVILGFCENLAELGCPQDEESPDMWFRYLSPKEQEKVAKKLLNINLEPFKRCKKQRRVK